MDCMFFRPACSDVLVLASALVIVKNIAIEFTSRESDEVYLLFGVVD